MINQEKIEAIRLLCGLPIDDESKDSEFSLLLSMAESEAKTRTNLSALPAELDPVVCKMVAYNYDKKGSVAVSSQSYASASESFIEDYPQEILNSLKAFRKFKFL